MAVYTNAAVPSQTEVLVRVDWQHRYDLMQQHTGDPIFWPSTLCLSLLVEIPCSSTRPWAFAGIRAAFGSFIQQIDCVSGVCVLLQGSIC